MGGGAHFQKDLPGIEIELDRHMARQLGLGIEIVRIPWKRCLMELKVGRLDGVFPACFKPEQEKIGVFPFKSGKIDPTRKSRDSAYHLYRLQTSPLTWRDDQLVNLEQMPRTTIGVPLEWSIAENLRRRSIDVLERPRPVELLEMLSRGGLARVVCLATVSDVYIDQAPHKYRQIEKVYPPVAEKTDFLMLSHQFTTKHPVIAENIWDTIAELRIGDVYQSISNRYTNSFVLKSKLRTYWHRFYLVKFPNN